MSVVNQMAPGQVRSIAPEPDASVWMPDENLRKEVRKKFGIKDDKGTHTSTDDTSHKSRVSQ